MKIEEKIGEALKNKQFTVSTAESCTGGGIAFALTSVPGSSSYFKGSIVAYSNEIKNRLLGIPLEAIDKYGVVSEENATLMAKNAMNTLKTDCAIATTGIAGPGGGTKDTPVGTIWIAVAHKNDIITKQIKENFGRSLNINKAIENALFMLYNLVK